MRDKEYIGDGVYARFDGYHIWLTTEDGIRVTNRIALDPHTLQGFLNYIERLSAELSGKDDAE